MASRTEEQYARLDRLAEEFAERWRRGERPPLQEFTDRCPELADDIRELFPALVEMAKAEPDAPPDADRTVPDAGGLPDAAPPTHAGRCELGAEIGRGGMGAVLAGRDPALDRPLAVKVLLPGRAGDADLERRFLAEAQVCGQLQHPGVVPVYDVGRLADGRPFFTMKLVKGRTLADLLAERPSPSADLPRFVQVFEQVCQAVAYAHSRGVIHRDLKPANVMVGEFGEVQVMDWGLAKVLTGGAPTPPASSAPPASTIYTVRTGANEHSREGTVLGTPAYMAPEQARGEVEALDACSDVFGLGAILCEVLTGAPPYVRRDAAAAHLQAVRGDLADARARLEKSGADPELIALAKRCLSADPAGRPRDAGETAAAVTAHRESVEWRLRQAELAQAETAAARKRRRLLGALAGSVLLTALAAAGGALWYAWDRSTRRAAAERSADVTLGKAELSADQARAIEQKADQAGGVEPETPEAAKQALALWGQAYDSLGEAERMLAGVPGAEEARGRLASRRGEVEVELRRAEKEAQLLADLDRMRALLSYRQGYESWPESYAAALRLYGLEASCPEAETAEAIRRERPAVRLALIVALDEWAICVGGPEAARLRRIADGADDDGWRRRLRAAETAGDLGELRRLAEEARRPEAPAVGVDLLGNALMRHGARGRGEAEGLLRQARRLHPMDFWIHFDMGNCLLLGLNRLNGGMDLDEAVGCYWAALALRPDCALAHDRLGVALRRKGDNHSAIACFNIALKLDPTLAPVHSNLGEALNWVGDEDGAVAHCKEAVELDPKYAPAHLNLGAALGKRDFDAAVACYRKALELDPKYAEGHWALGLALQGKGDGGGAVACFRKALELKPDDPFGHFALGKELLKQGRFAEAKESARRVLELLYPDDEPFQKEATSLLQRCERLLALEAKLGPVLRGDQEPADNAERLGFAEVCYFQRRYAAAARFYRDSLADDPELADDLTSANRYNGTCSAALAGCGQGADAPADEGERARLRAQALAWLRADLALWGKAATGGDPNTVAAVRQTLRHWREDADLAGVRDADALVKLPEAERADWRKLWADVDALLQKAAPPK
jgi:serine/threonine-protein kinase